MRRVKPIRSALFVPGNREDRILKAPRFGADALILDLEDAVALPDKERSRGTVRRGNSRTCRRTRVSRSRSVTIHSVSGV